MKLRVGMQNVAKVVVIFFFFAAWSLIYDQVNEHSARPDRTIHLTRPVDRFPGIIQPWTAVIYVFGGIALPLLPFVYNWTWPRLRFVLTCYAVTSMLAFACYWLWPLGIVRPIFLGNSLGERLMRGVFTIDREANCFPSGHTFFATLGGILVWRGGASGAVSRSTWVLAVAVCATTVTTGQHYFIDVTGGVAAALLGYTTTRMLMPPTKRVVSGRAVTVPSNASHGG